MQFFLNSKLHTKRERVSESFLESRGLIVPIVTQG